MIRVYSDKFGLEVVTDLYFFEQDGINEWNGTGTNGDKYYFMLSSGVLDVSGKEIFQGDILRESEAIDGRIIDSEYCLVGHEHGCLVLDFGKLGVYSMRDRLPYKIEFETGKTTSRTLEVVGNIYENPDMISLIKPRG